MTDPQALELAKRIMNCWRGGTPLADWVAELARLEHQPAVAAYERLRRLIDVAPSIPRFLSEYQALDARNVAPVGQWKPSERRLTRAERVAILTRAGAPRRLIEPPSRLVDPGANPP